MKIETVLPDGTRVTIRAREVRCPRFGVLFEAVSDLGEPRMARRAYRSALDAIGAELRELNRIGDAFVGLRRVVNDRRCGPALGA